MWRHERHPPSKEWGESDTIQALMTLDTCPPPKQTQKKGEGGQGGYSKRQLPIPEGS